MRQASTSRARYTHSFLPTSRDTRTDLCLKLLRISRYRNPNFHLDISGRGIHLADCMWPRRRRGLSVNEIDHANKTALQTSTPPGAISHL